MNNSDYTGVFMCLKPALSHAAYTFSACRSRKEDFSIIARDFNVIPCEFSTLETTVEVIMMTENSLSVQKYSSSIRLASC